LLGTRSATVLGTVSPFDRFAMTGRQEVVPRNSARTTAVTLACAKCLLMESNAGFSRGRRAAVQIGALPRMMARRLAAASHCYAASWNTLLTAG